MKTLDIKYFTEIKEAYDYNSASSHGWADSRVREIQDYLISGNTIEIVDGQERSIINSIEDLINWKIGKKIESISFNLSKDNLKLIEKLNVNIRRFAVDRITLILNNSNDRLFEFDNIDFSLFSPSGQSFYAGIKNVLYTNFEIPCDIKLSNLKCRLAYSNEIDDLKNLINTKGQLILAFEYINMETNNKDIRIIVGRELEN